MAVHEQAAPTVPSGAAEGAGEARRGFPWGLFGRVVGVIVVVIIAIFPFYWSLNTSVKSVVEQNYSPPTLIPLTFTITSYIDVLTSNQPEFSKDLLNSAICAASATVLCLLFGSLCAYAIARLKFKGKGIVLGIVLSVVMIPLVGLVGPLYVLFTSQGFYVYNTYVALIIPYIVISLPLTVWFLTSFFRDLPADLEEAALVDGDTRLGALRHVVLPLTAPGVFTTAILSFIAAWNDFLFGLTLTADPTAQPVTVAIPLFSGEHTINYGDLGAAAVIVTIPLVILVLIFQRRIVSGLTAGAVKG